MGLKLNSGFVIKVGLRQEICFKTLFVDDNYSDGSFEV